MQQRQSVATPQVFSVAEVVFEDGARLEVARCLFFARGEGAAATITLSETETGKLHVIPLARVRRVELTPAAIETVR